MEKLKHKIIVLFYNIYNIINIKMYQLKEIETIDTFKQNIIEHNKQMREYFIKFIKQQYPTFLEINIEKTLCPFTRNQHRSIHGINLDGVCVYIYSGLCEKCMTDLAYYEHHHPAHVYKSTKKIEEIFQLFDIIYAVDNTKNKSIDNIKAVIDLR